MPRKIGGVARSILVNAPLPEATDTYTVISHNFVITKILKTLEDNGFEVNEELYRCTKDAQVASGIYRINYDNDPDMGMIFAFGNSYDKSMRFKCAIGAYLYKNQASLISKMSDWNRKHTGTADQETQETIENQIQNAGEYFRELKEQKEAMMLIELEAKQFHRLMGELYFSKLITGEQLSIVKREFEKPSYKYETSPLNLWTLYNHILVALKISHPRTWMEQQTMIHLKLAVDFGLIAFDSEEEALDKKQSVLSSNSQGNLSMFLPGYAPTNSPEPLPEAVQFEAEEDWDDEEEVILTEPEEIDEEETILDSEKTFVEALEEKMIEQAEEDAKVLEELAWGGDVAEVPETAPERVKFAVDLTEEELIPIEEEEIIEEEIIEQEIIEDDEEPINDFPEITGIPNGNTMSDTSDLDAEEDEEWEQLEAQGVITPIEIKAEEVEEEILEEEIEVPWIEDEESEVTEEVIEKETIVESTGVLFDLEEGYEPGIKPVVGLDEPVQIMSPEEAKQKSQAAQQSLEIEEVEVEETIDTAVESAIASELEELYGYKPKFTFKESGDQYNIILESGESVVLSAAYINSIIG
jgi:hypothetical protein